jgi:hypothetical protein
MTCPIVEVPLTTTVNWTIVIVTTATLLLLLFSPILAVELAITTFFPLGPIACNVDGLDMAAPALRRLAAGERASCRITRPT